MTNEEKANIKFFLVPDLFIKDSFHEFQKVNLDWKKWLHVYKTAYLREAVLNLKERHWNMGKGYPENFAYESERYINGILDILNPEVVVLWNQFHAFHHIIGAVCKKRNIQVIYYEFGVLPGTYALELQGQMGESYPAKCYQEFRNLPVTKSELEEAKKVWEFLKVSKLNRKVQKINNDLDILKSKLKSNRPTIFFAGQNDFESGICPYTRNTKKNHSPIFRSSDKAAIELANICKKNDWNFVYKRHPLVSCFISPEKLSVQMPDNVLMFDNIDISEVIEIADVTMTILSQVGYVSTILKKPTIMLGYMQLKGKGCTYEAFQKEDIEFVIKQALKDGFTKEQEEAFIKHIAQLNKYYIFNDPFVERDIYYGRDLDQCTKFFLDSINNASAKKHTNNGKCTQMIISKNIWYAIRGRKVWRQLYDSQSINFGTDRIIIIPEEDKRTQYYAMLYLNKLLERLYVSNAVIVTDSQLVSDTIGLFTKKIKSVTQITKKSMDMLLKYQIVFGNSDIVTIASLDRYTGRLSEGLLGIEGITTEELIAVGVYDLSYFYHVKKLREKNIANTYLQLYFPKVGEQIMKQKMDLSQKIEFVEGVVSKRGVISFIISDNVANLSLYLNKIGSKKNEIGAIIPKKYAPIKDIMTVASSAKGENYMVTIKTNGEIWFNFYDNKQYPILLNCTWIV